jgi:hypothetical protein
MELDVFNCLNKNQRIIGKRNESKPFIECLGFFMFCIYDNNASSYLIKDKGPKGPKRPKGQRTDMLVLCLLGPFSHLGPLSFFAFFPNSEFRIPNFFSFILSDKLPLHRLLRGRHREYGCLYSQSL